MLAAFANGSMAHAMDFEDTYDEAVVHPNAASIPAALAVAEARGDINGKQLITAITIGCDIVCRLGLGLTVPPDDFGWYTPPILGAFGATASAGHLLGLNPEQMRDAFSIALCQATCSAEIKYSPNSVVRAVRDAFAAKTGVLSSQLAARGVAGFDLPFEGKAGFFSIFSRNNYDPETVIRDLGYRFEIERVSFKPWPTCRGTHVFIEAALELARQHHINTKEIKHIRASGDRIMRMLAEPEQQKKHPSTVIDAKFSIPFSVATALCYNSVTLEHITTQSITDDNVLELADKVTFEVMEPADSTMKNVSRGSLTIETTEGQKLSMLLEHPLGHPDRSLDDEFLINKFKQCASCSSVSSDASRLQNIIECVLSLEKMDNVSMELMPLLKGNPD